MCWKPVVVRWTFVRSPHTLDCSVIGAVQSRHLAFARGTSTVRLTLELEVPSSSDDEQELSGVGVYVVDGLVAAEADE